MIRFVYVDFGPQGTLEPRKWHRIIHENFYCPEIDNNDIRRRIRACWLSEFDSSLNLLVEVQPTSEDAIRAEMDRLKMAFIGSKMVAIAEEAEVQIPQTATIIPFPRRTAA